MKKTVKKVKNKTAVKKIAKEHKDIEKLLPSAEEMLKQGVHFGHQTSRWNAKMKPYIFTVRNNVHILDLEKARGEFKKALEYFQKVKEKKGIILFVGTKVAASEIIRESAEKCGMPYVNKRWIGGTLTNFKVISKRLEHFRDLEEKKEKGELKKYTKKEQHEFNLELQKLERQFGGLKKITKLPDALLVIDTHKEKLSIKEARKRGIPVVGLCDSNANPTLVDYPIPGNDDAISSLKLILETIVKVLK